MTKKRDAKKEPWKKPERREFPRTELPAFAQAWDAEGNELGRIGEVGAGGLLLDPASPFARVTLRVGQQLKATFIEPSTGNRTTFPVEVRYLRDGTIGLRFL